jgi:hypothetical protein
MDSRQITNLWRTSLGGQCPPTGHLCRSALHDRWLRIHSLPDSKRYAETELERIEILRRNNEVATATLGEMAPCVLFITRFTPGFDETEINSWLPTPLSFSSIAELQRPESDEEDEINIFAAEIQWRHGGFNSLLTAVADDLAYHVLFANLSRGTAYHPYDGGADLFLESPASVVAEKKKWSSWLSGRDDGL